jgi:hypothetical protein
LNHAKCKKTSPTAGAGPNLANLRQTKESNKQKTSDQAPTGIVGVGPQSCKVEPNKKKKKPTNQRTSEQETTSEPVKNICIFNDD